MTPRTMLEVALAIVIGGCRQAEDSSSVRQPRRAEIQLPSAEARQIFESRCSTCHGMRGRGDGPGAVTLIPKPRNYMDSTWQKSTTDEDIRKVIALGGIAVGKSAAMPGNVDLEDRPAVVEELIRIIRAFGRKDG